MRNISVGIIGAGGISRLHAMAIATLDNVSLAGFADRSFEFAKAKAEEFNTKAFESVDAMLADKSVDAVIIATPSGMHRDSAVAAANAGKHILCEKPLEINTARIDDVIEACDKNAVKLGCIFQMRVSPSVSEVRKVMQAGRFGKMLLASANMRWYRDNNYYDSSNWRGTWKFDGGGALINQAVHMVDTLLFINGDVEAVSAFSGTFTHNIEVEDNLCATLKYRNGSFGTIEVSTCCAPGFPRRMEFSGANGTVAIEEDKISRWEFVDQKAEDEEILKAFSGTSNENGGRSPLDISFKGHAIQIADFADAIRNDTVPMVDGREARRAIELICAIYESAKSGKTVYLQGADK